MAEHNVVLTVSGRLCSDGAMWKERTMPDTLDVLRGLHEYCMKRDWAGYEPYDAVNSPLFSTIPVLDSRIPRLVLTQALKRSPVNIRKLLGIKAEQNPKAIGLFLSAYVRLGKLGVFRDRDYASDMIERLIQLRSPGEPYWCWGYCFPWQTRTVLVPRWTPNLVCTSFAALALVDAYEDRGESRCLEMAESAAAFILDRLYWMDGDYAAGFGYPLPSVRDQIHNANFLAASLLCKVYKHTGRKEYLDVALRCTRYSVARQHEDGGWDYGEARHQRWIDNIHTGFNLCALQSVSESVGTTEFLPALRRGLHFYLRNFILGDGAVRYYHNRTHPIDSHCVAQSIITLKALCCLESGNEALARSVLHWALAHLWDDRGFFYYRRLRSLTIRTSYMRWTQAWMFLALATLVSAPTVCEQMAQQGAGGN